MSAIDPQAPAGAAFKITRLFDAPRDLVWKAWTDPALMARWFGPKGVVTTVIAFDVRTGGAALSRMDGPNGLRMWAKFVYREVVEPCRLVWVHSFGDEHGNVVRGPFDDTWPLELLATASFDEEGEGTRITLTWFPLDATDAERATFDATVPSMTMGWTNSFDQLDALLSERK